MRVLVGDVGGTKTALGLYEADASGGYRALSEKTYASTQFPSLLAVLHDFLPANGNGASADIAVFSVAGPVNAGTCATTNLPWMIAEAELQRELKIPVALINDFHAVAIGVMHLRPSELRVLQLGTRDPNGVYAVIGAGTGLGEAVAVPMGRTVRVLPGEGGHADFAPRDEEEWRLFRFLRQHTEHISVERVVSGMGLASLYDFVVADGQAPDDPETRRRFAREQRGAVIGDRAALDPAAARALALFASAYGAEAGNLALKVLPTGGLYVAGGIAARMADRLAWDSFMDSFLGKGRMGALLRSIPVSVVLHASVGLVGARAHAALLWRDRTLH